MPTFASWWRQARGLPPVVKPRLPEKEPEAPVYMPESIDFSALWDDPQESGSLPVILGIINAVLLVVILVMIIIQML